MQITDFLKPKMVGARYDNHTIPLEMLRDIAVLEEMVVEVAKWCYLQDHPNRERSPKGFSDGMSLHLSGVGEGSAMPDIKLYSQSAELVPPHSVQYVEKARDRILGAINAAGRQENITTHLPPNLLVYFDRIGRGLQADEIIEFSPGSQTGVAVLSQDTRKLLVRASSKSKSLTNEVTLRGSIPEMDQLKMTFQLHVLNGPVVVAPVPEQHFEVIMDAFQDFKTDGGTKVMLKGVGKFDQYDNLKAIESVEHINLLDDNDIVARVESLKKLRNGWLDGRAGKVLDKRGLEWLVSSFERITTEEMPLPFIYPTPEGGVQAEWSIAAKEITLEIDMTAKTGEWQSIGPGADEFDRGLDLSKTADWEWISEQLLMQENNTDE